ncbi:MAG: PD-(D/E)XK nuclease family protein [Cytophagales bacterium]|nr:MAG: PD-(D/E)XK nuclease family protein [Cytophagales bacterium]
MQLPFLQQVAIEILQKYKGTLPTIHLVLPTNRACLYMKHYLAQIAEQSFIAPEILSINDFVRKIADVEVADSVTLLFDLFESFTRTVQADEAGSLEKFVPLGSSLLNDFNMIDMNLVNPDTFFDYLAEAKAIERWAMENLGIEDEEEIENLEEFEAEKAKIQAKVDGSPNTQDYYAFWGYLKDTYNDFKKSLLAKNTAYQGLAFRKVVENIKKYVSESEVTTALFIGFNQLAKVEEKLMQEFYAQGKADFYWEVDSYYFANKGNEAGHYLRQYAEWIGKENFKWVGNRISSEPKKIHILSVGNKVTQAKLIGDILEKKLAQIVAEGKEKNFKESVNQIGIVLPDETMLMPVLHSLPVAEKDTNGLTLKEYLNVTMGLSIDKTPLFYLIDNLFSFQENLQIIEQNGERYVKVYYKDIIKILRHPFIQYSKSKDVKTYQIIKDTTEKLKELDKEVKELEKTAVQKGNYDKIQEHLEKIQKENLIYIPLYELTEEWGQSLPFYKKIFSFWKKDGDKNAVPNAIQTLFDLVEVLADLFDEEHNVLENEYLLQFYTMLNRINDILGEKKNELTIRTFKHFLYENIRNAAVPFTGEPLSPVQVMGMLESRTLDFETVIIPSCNEGVLPKGKLIGSVIPFDVRVRFKIPTHIEGDASYAFTFFRLFHHAKEVFLIYPTSSGASLGGTEPSRYLTQIKSEMTALPNLEITEQQLVMSLPDSASRKIEIKKTPEILKRVEDFLANNYQADASGYKEKGGLTPSVINMYLKNPLEFFQKKILKLKDPNEVEEQLLANTFGSVIHDFLEKTMLHLKGTHVSEKELSAIIQNDQEMLQMIEEIIRKHKGGIVTEKGKNFILKGIASYLIKNFVKIQAEKETPFFVVEQENHLASTLWTAMPNGKKVRVFLNGKTDRIDVVNNNIRIVDYKTGTFSESNLKADSKDILLQNPDKEKVVQLMLYKYMLIKEMQSGRFDGSFPEGRTSKEALTDYPILSGYYFFRKMKKGFVGYELKDEPKNREDFMPYAEDFVHAVVREMLDESKPFKERSAEENAEEED